MGGGAPPQPRVTQNTVGGSEVEESSGGKGGWGWGVRRSRGLHTSSDALRRTPKRREGGAPKARLMKQLRARLRLQVAELSLEVGGDKKRKNK